MRQDRGPNPQVETSGRFSQYTPLKVKREHDVHICNEYGVAPRTSQPPDTSGWLRNFVLSSKYAHDTSECKS